MTWVTLSESATPSSPTAKPKSWLDVGVTSDEFTVQKTMLPVATTGAMLKSPVMPTGVPGEALLMPRTVTVTGAPAALLAKPLPAASPPSVLSPSGPAQMLLGR